MVERILAARTNGDKECLQCLAGTCGYVGTCLRIHMDNYLIKSHAGWSFNFLEAWPSRLRRGALVVAERSGLSTDTVTQSLQTAKSARDAQQHVFELTCPRMTQAAA